MKQNRKYTILTPTGFSEFAGIKKLQKHEYLEIILHNNSITCSFEHKFIVNNHEIFAKSLNKGDTLDTMNGLEAIKNIIIHDNNIDLYDILDVNHDNIFYANDIITHNCDASFLSSGDTMIDGETIDWYEQNTVIMEPINKLYHDNLWLWGEPDSTKQYMIPVDVSRGDATDYSSFHILDIETLEQVGEYKGKVPTPELPKILAEVGYMWNTAVISIENASMGWGVVQDMITAEYPNLYYTPKKEITNEYEYQDLEHFTPGFTNSSKSRPLMISKFEEYINNKLIIIRGIRTINELKRFVWLNHKAQAAPGANDDLMLSLAQGIYLREPILRFFKLGIANYHNNKKENLAVFSSYKPGFNTMNKTDRRVKDTYFDNNETTFQRNKMKEHTKSRSKMVPLP